MNAPVGNPVAKSIVLQKMVALLQSLKTWYPHIPLVLTREDVRTVCQFVARDNEGEFTTALAEYRLVEMLDTLNVAMGDYKVRLQEAHEEDGIAWLWGNRKSMLALGQHELHIMRHIMFITFCGVATRPGPGKVLRTAPIYCVVGNKELLGTRNSFTYEAWSWQSNVKPCII